MMWFWVSMICNTSFLSGFSSRSISWRVAGLDFLFVLRQGQRGVESVVQ